MTVRNGGRSGFLSTWGLPLVAGPSVTALCGLALFLAYGAPDDPLRTTLAPEAAEVVPDGGTRTVAALTDVAVPEARDVTPDGVTPGPPVTGPLRRIVAEAAPELDRPEPTHLFRRIVVLDAGRFRAVRDGDAVVIRLAGIQAPAFDQTCRDSAGVEWKCGAKARAQLARLIGGRSVQCSLVDTADPTSPTAHCAVGPRDLAKWLVEMGWAEPAGHDRVLTPLDAAARDQRRGRYGPAPVGVIAG